MKTWIASGGTVISQVLGGRSNVFLVSRGKNRLLFDTSSNKCRDRLFRNLDKMRISSIDVLVLSHSHFDHVGNAAKVQDRFGAKVLVHDSEASYLKQGYSPVPPGTVLFTRLLVWLFARKLHSWFRYEPCQPYELVHDSYDLSEFGMKARLIHTPGHTTGMTSLIVEEEVALVGDALFGIFPGSVFPPFANNINQLIQSWGKLLKTDCRWFLPSHGWPVSRHRLEKCYLKKMSVGQKTHFL